MAEQGVAAPAGIATLVDEAGRLSEAIKEAEPRYKELRKRIWEGTDGSVRSGRFLAVYTPSSTKEVLNLERATAELAAAGEDLAAFQCNEVHVSVEDAHALLQVLEEAGIKEDEAGVASSTSPRLDEQRLGAKLAELDVLEACLAEKTTRQGYVWMRAVGGTEP